MRLFVAIYPSAEAVDHLASFVGELGVGRAAASGVNIRLAPPETYHLTVAFLGDVPDARLPDAEAALAAATTPADLAGSVPHSRRASDLRAPKLRDRGEAVVRIGGGGRFGRGRFSVLWAGLRGETEPLVARTRVVRRALKRARLPYDDRRWKPHLTIARPGDRLDRAQLDADRAALAAYEGPSWPAAELVLVRSHLGPKPTYDRLGSWPL